GDDTLDQYLVVQLRRIEVLGDAALVAEVVGLAFVFGKPARNSLGIAHHGARHKRQVLRLKWRSAEEYDEKKVHRPLHSTLRKFTRSSFSRVVSRMSNRRS